MANDKTAAAETTVLSNIFEGANTDVAANFTVNQDTLFDAIKIPTEIAFEKQIKAAGATVKAQRAEVEARTHAWAEISVATTDEAAAGFVAAVVKSAEAARRALFPLATASAFKLPKVVVEARVVKVDEADARRKVQVDASTRVDKSGVYHTDDDDDAKAGDVVRVRGVTAAASAGAWIPFTVDQVAALAAKGEAEATLRKMEADFRELVAEKETVIQGLERRVRMRYAQIASESVPGMKGVQAAIFDGRFARAVFGDVKQFDAGALMASGDAPIPDSLPAPEAKQKKSK